MVKINNEKFENAGKKTKGLLAEFRTFIERGNVLDLAVGVVIGGAFSKIVTSLVDDIIMPLIGVLIGGIDFSNLSITVDKANIKYGLFLQNILDFIIIALCIFLMVKLINKFFDKIKKVEDKPKAKSAEVVLLEEIRDELKK